MPVEDDRAADDGRVTGESPPPELVAKDHRLRSVPAALGVVEEASGQRLDAEHGKEVLGHGHAGEAFRLAPSRETHIARSVEGEHTGNAAPRAALCAQRE